MGNSQRLKRVTDPVLLGVRPYLRLTKNEKNLINYVCSALPKDRSGRSGLSCGIEALLRVGIHCLAKHTPKEATSETTHSLVAQGLRVSKGRRGVSRPNRIYTDTPNMPRYYDDTEDAP